MAARILLIYTGGTIGMVSDPGTGALKPLNFREIESEIPALRRLGVEIGYHESFTPIDSSDVTPDVWARLAEVIRDNYAHFDGFVVLHGTDTMAYTASALSFMLEGLAKPVVFTGSQIPIGVLRTDGRENLVTAVEIAAARTSNDANTPVSGNNTAYKKQFLSERTVCKACDGEGRRVYWGVNDEPVAERNAADGALSQKSPQVPEVSIYFQNALLRANRTTKWSAEQLNAFTSENYPALAEVGVAIHYNDSAIARPAAPADPDGLEISTSLDRNVAMVRLFPGIEPHVFEATLGIDGLRGVVLQTYGTGNTPTAPWFFEALDRAISRGIVIVNITQCIAGGVQPIYESGARLTEAGVVNGGDMTPEAAITKLMYVLGRGLSPEDVRDVMVKSLRGEISR